MTDLFGFPIPLRVVLHLNLHSGGGRFDWDGMAQNPDTGDVVGMTASPARLRSMLGPELSQMLLWTHGQVLRAEGEGELGEEPPTLDP